jgi:hypothetical protein
MALNNKKIFAFTGAILLSIIGIGAVSAPAHAADCPYPVTDQTDNDHPVDSIHLISPVLTDDNSIHRYDFEGQFTQDCDWFGVGMQFHQVYVPFGLRTTFTFHAANTAGNALANTTVKLRVNKGYSASNAAVRVNGIKARPAPSNAADGADISATTDANGNVSYVIVSPDDCTTYGGVLPAAPASLDSDVPNQVNNDPATDCFSQVLPQITGEKTDAADFVEIHYFNPAALSYTAASSNVALLTPVLDGTNSINVAGEAMRPKVQTYANVGAKQIVAFQATKDDGSWARNVPITVHVNVANSGGNAAISAGIIGNAGNGASTTLSNTDATKTSADQLVLTGNTDAFGVVTFQLNNNDTAGEPAPATKTSPVPVSGQKFASLSANLDGFMDSSTIVEVHYYKAVPLVTSITAVAVAKKITVTINNAIGKSSTVTITGLKKATVTPTKASQAYTYTVTKGVKTVTVVSNGKTLTKKFTIK